jgi:hypothetical protein
LPPIEDTTRIAGGSPLPQRTTGFKPVRRESIPDKSQLGLIGEPQIVEGKIGEALSFDGTDDYVVMGAVTENGQI